MAFFDLSLDDLHRYRPSPTHQPDFEQFWRQTLAEAAQEPLNITTTPLDLPYQNVACSQLCYAGWGGTSIIGTFLHPVGMGPFPAVAIYHGYGSRQPSPFDLLGWVLEGYAVFATDVRGQSGHSSDSSGYQGGHVPGFLTLGIHDPADYYYRRVFIDSLRALEVLAAQPMIDPHRLVVTGSSQGGGLTLATAALHGLSAPTTNTLCAAFAEIPFLCHFDRAATFQDSGPYVEIGSYCRRSGTDPAVVFRTLSYFDCMNLAQFITAPTMITTGLMDTICPPSTVFAAYHAISAPKEIFVSYFGDHQTFPTVHEERMRWVTTHMPRAHSETAE